MGIKEGNKHADKKLNEGREAVGKKIVLGMEDSDTGYIVAKAFPNTKSKTVQPFVLGNTHADAVVSIDEAESCTGLVRGTSQHRILDTLNQMSGDDCQNDRQVPEIQGTDCLNRTGTDSEYFPLT